MKYFVAFLMALLSGCSGPSSNLSTTDDWVQVSVGHSHACGLHADGTVECWGNGGTGLLDVKGEGYRVISAGTHHTCGLIADDQAVCWGFSGFFDELNGPSSPVYERIDSGWAHSCGLTPEGTVDCWGCDDQQDNGQCEAPAGQFDVVVAGQHESCAATVDGQGRCWGPTTASTWPDSLESVVSVTAGTHHYCALSADGTPYCWGCVGGGEDACVSPEGRFIQLTAGWHYTCGLGEDGQIDCWGCELNGYGVNSDTGQCDAPEGDRYTQISAGEFGACAVREDGHLECWGCVDRAIENNDADSGQCDPP